MKWRKTKMTLIKEIRKSIPKGLDGVMLAMAGAIGLSIYNPGMERIPSSELVRYYEVQDQLKSMSGDSVSRYCLTDELQKLELKPKLIQEIKDYEVTRKKAKSPLIYPFFGLMALGFAKTTYNLAYDSERTEPNPEGMNSSNTA